MKYETIDDLTREIFTDVLKSTSLVGMVRIALVANSKLKQAAKLSKCSEITEFLSEGGYNFYLEVNEQILLDLERKHQDMVIDEELSYVGIHPKSGNFVKLPADLTTNKGIVRKYGLDEYEKMKEFEALILEQLNDKG